MFPAFPALFCFGRLEIFGNLFILYISQSATIIFQLTGKIEISVTIKGPYTVIIRTQAFHFKELAFNHNSSG